VSARRELISIYTRIGRTYYRRAPSLLLLSLVVFVPLGLLDAIAAEVSVDSLDLSSGIKVAAVLVAVGAITLTGLLGEVFYSGAVAVSLTHPEHEGAPPLSEVARRLDYRRLILVDIAYVALVLVGLLFVLIPGVLVFVWFGLSGPVVEIEKRTVRGAFARSWHLVRGNFWMVLLVLGPIEVVGDLLGDALAGLVHDLLGDGFLAGWLAETVSNVVLTPAFAIAAVLLTLDLIAAKDGPAAGGVRDWHAPRATPRR
jgi:hypothetical protein